VSGYEERWTTATPTNSSPVERERDRLIERAILRDGPREHYEPSRGRGPAYDDFDDDGEWILDAPCGCFCHPGAKERP
jgi:hypothetical protein